jgi:RNA polymerase sigma-70 factor (ECF subfamily)
MAEGVDVGLRWIDAIAERGELDDYHLVAAARADLLRRSGRFAEAAAAYAEALLQVRNPAERAYLGRRLREARVRA